MTALDTRPPRSLTSREIAALLSGFVAGLHTMQRPLGAFRWALEGFAKSTTWGIAAVVANPQGETYALNALLGSLASWCDPVAIQTAIQWVLARWTVICDATTMDEITAAGPSPKGREGSQP